MPPSLRIYEVGPRDGLQNSKVRFSTSEKVELIKMLENAGISHIEMGSFVNPALVPAMSDTAAVFREVIGQIDAKTELGALIPNEKGFKTAIMTGLTHFNIFFSPSEAFNARNLGKTRNEAFLHFKNVLKDIPKENIRVYVSCAFGCPFEGEIDSNLLKKAIQDANELGSTVVLCDTVGKANPKAVERVLHLVDSGIKAEIALHLHEGVRGRSGLFENIETAVGLGVHQFDTSIGGLGGCPFMPGSGVNVATEDLVEWANERGLDTGVCENALAEVAAFVASRISPMEVAQ